MKLLLLYWSMMILGYFIGSKSRDVKEKFSRVGIVTFAAIIFLVYVMGVRMGSNAEVVANLGPIGLDAFFMTVVIMAGSVLAVLITRKLLGIDRYGESQLPRGNAEICGEPEASNGNGYKIKSHSVGNDQTAPKDNSGRIMTIAILIAVVIGIISGYLFVESLFADYGDFENLSGNAMVIGLCFLLLFVGIDFGLSGTITQNLKKAGFSVLVFPVAIVLGTFIAAFLCGLVLPISQKEALAIGAGFGWYTLAPIVITEQGYAIAGAIAFMHNVMRELGGIVLIPIVAQKIGYLEAIALPGVAAMDICVPIVERACGEKIVIYSFLVGLLQSALVPVLVPLIIGF